MADYPDTRSMEKNGDRAIIIISNPAMTTPDTKLDCRMKSFRIIVLLAVSAVFCSFPLASYAVDAIAMAYPGQPFGVATIEIPVNPPTAVGTLPALQVRDSSGRIFYPTGREIRVKVVPYSERPVPEPGRGRLFRRVGNLIREIANGDKEEEETVARRVTFLYRGNSPLVVNVSDERGEIAQYELQSETDPGNRTQLLQNWWADYVAAAKQQIDRSDYPPWVETYLVAMLSNRIGLPLPAWFDTNLEDEDALLSTLKLFGGAADASETSFRKANINDVASPVETNLPLPDAPNWLPESRATSHANVEIESLANRVPPECFYIRYGSFENYLWFRDLSEEYSGDLTSMVTLRGFQNEMSAAIESQLNLTMNQLSRMLGPTVIDDQAIIGRDLFLNEGASIGVLFKVKNAFLFRTSLQNDRSTRANSDKSIELSSVKIAGHDVSFLHSADNRVRSFLAENGDTVIVTNSETLVRRFLEVSNSGQSLAKTGEFQYARSLMPLSRKDTIFAYFSSKMLEGLVSPEFLVELRRRLDAKADITLTHLARYAAAAEGEPTRSIDELVSRGFLPDNFDSRVDRSGVVSVGDEVIDLRRGARGFFLPIVDSKIEKVTAEEAEWYRNIANAYSARFPQMDPIMLGLHRDIVSDGSNGSPLIEQLTVHAEIAPWSPGKYGKWARQLGPPTRVSMQFAPDDIVAVQAHVASPQLGPPTHLFAAIKDTVPPNPDDFSGFLNIYRSLKQLPGYLGAWPLPGALDRLPLGLGQGQPVGPGMNRLIGGLYRYTGGGFSVLSFQPDVLNATLPFLATVEVDDAAQIRARIGNIKGSQLETWVNAQLYERTAVASAAGANFYGMLSRQLNVSPSEATKAATYILQSPLQDPLGGEYIYNAQSERWTSTAWHADWVPKLPPEDYEPPIMHWFRGGQATLTQHENRIVVDAMMDVQRGN